MTPEKWVNIVEYCAAEVYRQQRGPIQVGWMVRAWDYALKSRALYHAILKDDLLMIGHMIEPELNDPKGWRRVNVRVGNRICPSPDKLETLMTNLMHLGFPDISPEESYKEFEMIHPFVDGNGRAGKIIFNWLRGTLDDPILPPNFFGCVNL